MARGKAGELTVFARENGRVVGTPSVEGYNTWTAGTGVLNRRFCEGVTEAALVPPCDAVSEQRRLTAPRTGCYGAGPLCLCLRVISTGLRPLEIENIRSLENKQTYYAGRSLLRC